MTCLRNFSPPRFSQTIRRGFSRPTGRSSSCPWEMRSGFPVAIETSSDTRPSCNAADQVGATTNAVVFIESNPRLFEETCVPGQLWDFDATRLLFLDAAGSLWIRHRATGLDTIVASNYPATIAWGANSLSPIAPGGLLTPQGAMLNIQRVSGNFGARFDNGAISVVQLDSGSEVARITDATSFGDLGANGSVTYTKADGSIFLSTLAGDSDVETFFLRQGPTEPM
jgi:hypothetical protein